MKNMPHIASRVLNKPLLLEPGYARTFFSALSSRLGISSLEDAKGQIQIGEKLRMSAETYTRTRMNKLGEEEVIYQVQDGVAIIPVQGTLVHKFGYLNPTSGMTGYDGILQRSAMAFSDDKVKAVLMDLDTPGGEVSGCFDASRAMRRLADAAGKPLWSLCYDMHCSAGMALASSAHRRLITETGVAGSVGVVMAHASFEQKLAEDGIAVTLIHSGAHKVEGNPYQNLPEDVLARFQTETDALRTEFSQLVADHMGMTLEEVLATEAATYRGKAAIDVGFADELVNGLDAVPLFSEHLSAQGRTITIGAIMDPKKTQAETPETQGPAAGTEAPAPTADVTQLQQEAAAAAQARIAGILQLEAAKGREATANHLAFNTTMSVEEAAQVLATVPEAATGAADMETALDRHMANEEQPQVGADASGGDEEPDLAAQMVSDYNAAKGVKA